MEEVLERKDIVGAEPLEGGGSGEEESTAGGHRPVLVPHVADLLQRPSTFRQTCTELS